MSSGQKLRHPLIIDAYVHALKLQGWQFYSVTERLDSNQVVGRGNQLISSDFEGENVNFSCSNMLSWKRAFPQGDKPVRCLIFT